MALTPYEPTTWVNDSEPDVDATNLNKIEQGIQEAIDGVNDILNSLTNQLSTDQTKFAGIAVVNTLNSNLNNKIKTTTYSCTSDSFGLVDFNGASFTDLHGILSVNVVANSRPALYSSGGSNVTAKYGYAIYNNGTGSYERAASVPCQLTITYW